ncbi:hypothetical protein [Neorhizobium petrolearium]|uniref:Uncharacterized protein n=1 Tax=Neorhizobium petrolearium TaxID=515361 RepID=A0ABY8M262_9HYPH|nr:hypothetical protein [Neorhizobium petrolearium]MCC2608363.1 hypothetical protein [Neorhizobium petrolearium]WGI68642.1 hypothetical protein QEO92_00645 [Neorhizobium petrolearium]
MSRILKTNARNIETEMFDLYRERGAMTDADLIRAGFTQEEIAAHAPKVAARIREAGQAAA